MGLVIYKGRGASPEVLSLGTHNLPKTSTNFKIRTDSDSARQIEEKLEARFLIAVL